jgi:flagellar hook protein FlgE
MTNALFAALSGLRASESSLDVIGNNVANANTVGYRGGRVNFGDLLSLTLSNGSAPTGLAGGRNPIQIGLGVGVRGIDMMTAAGAFLATGRSLDLALFGNGFFVVSDGQRNLFTRAGTFGFDANGTLVESGTGFVAQSVLGGSIVVPPNAISPPNATSSVSVSGNLSSVVGGPLPEILSTSNPFHTGTAATVTGTATGPFSFGDGDTFLVSVDGNAPQTIVLTAAAFTAIGANIANATASEVAQVINAQASGFSAVDVGGAIELRSLTLGENSLLDVDDGVGSPASALGLSASLVVGTETTATSATDLNDLVSNQADYVVGDMIHVSGTHEDGTTFSDDFVYGTDGTTLGDLRDFVAGLVPEAAVTIEADGSLLLTSNTPGESSLSLSLQDLSGNVGSTNFGLHALTTTQEGTGPDEVTSGITIYDASGQSHVLTLTFQRVDDTTWDLFVSIPPGSGTILDGEVRQIRFNPDGSLSSVGGPGVGDPDVEIQFASGTETISLGLGTPGALDGLTQFGGPSTAQAMSQDGYGAGVLSDVAVLSDGTVQAFFTNGQKQSFGQLAIASFANPAGLLREGNTMFAESSNSGAPQLGPAGGPGGTIQAGVLENSNVDLAEEFVRLIEAQRGYTANARIIQTSREILLSLLNAI